MDQSSDKDLPIWAQILLGEEPAPERKQESREIPDDEASSEGGKAA